MWVFLLKKSKIGSFLRWHLHSCTDPHRLKQIDNKIFWEIMYEELFIIYLVLFVWRVPSMPELWLKERCCL